MQAGMEILALCVEMGGTISGEHGVGIEKMDAMRLVFGEPEIEVQRKVKRAFDPKDIANPGKMFPARQEVAHAA
jgi:glycolate oxidase